jgi:uncharacterized membrane protein YjdF
MTVLPFRANRPLQGMLLWLILLWAITAIDPYNRHDWLLENLLVFLYGFLLVISYRRFAFSNLSYALFTVFLSLHLVATNTYSETPFGFWLLTLRFGTLTRPHRASSPHLLSPAILSSRCCAPRLRVLVIPAHRNRRAGLQQLL